MKISSLLVLCVFFSLCGVSHAEDRRIILEDGTELIGEVLSLRNGSYTIRTKTLGTLTVSDRQIRQISSLSGGALPSGPSQSGTGQTSQLGVQAIQERMTSDSTMLQQIMALLNSPEMQAVLSDPEVMAAVERLDFEALANHPKIKRLMDNQSVRSITNQVN